MVNPPFSRKIPGCCALIVFCVAPPPAIVANEGVSLGFGVPSCLKNVTILVTLAGNGVGCSPKLCTTLFFRGGNHFVGFPPLQLQGPSTLVKDETITLPETNIAMENPQF